MDALSEVLRAAGLTGATILNADFRAPWCVAAGSSTALARGFLDSHEMPAVLHLVTAGECRVRLGIAEPLTLRAGDLVVFPHGDFHQLSGGTEIDGTSLAALVKPPIAGALVPVAHGGRGPRTGIVSALVGLDRRFADPLLASLPAMVRVDMRGAAAAEHLRDSLGLELSGSEAPRPGGMASLGRLAELVFIEAIRRHVESIAPGASGWLAALGDRYTGRALALLHARPGEDWKVERLARQVGLSRSALAERFTQLLGEPPITYLTHWRLRLAAQKLLGTRHGIAAIARAAGYESSGAFSHAFKRAFGKPPSIWRRRSAAPAQRRARERKGKETSIR